MKETIFLLMSLCVYLQVSSQDLRDTTTSARGNGLTRDDIENSKYAGFLFTDIKGVQLQFNGFIQADFIHDFTQIGNKYGFQPSTITIPQNGEQNTVFTMRQSRFAFTAFGPIDARGRNLKATLEFDLSGPNNTTAVRVRHAYLQHGKWLFGQTWSNFMDGSIWPNIMDAWGPNGYVLIRQVQLRFTQKIDAVSNFAVSMEQPGCDITIPSTWTARTAFPDATVSFTRNIGRGHLRLAGLLHPITYKDDKDKEHTLLGAAGNLSGSIAVAKYNWLKFQLAYGNGYAKYNEDLSGQGYDAYAIGNNLQSMPLLSGWIFYDHYWSNKWSSTVGWGYNEIYNNKTMPASSFRKSNYAAINMTHYFTDFFKIAAEVLYGNKSTIEDDSANSIRAQFSAFFKF